MNIEALAEEFEKQSELIPAQRGEQMLSDRPIEIRDAIGNVKERIVEEAVGKINDKKIIDKHAETIAQISDRALEVEAEKQRLIVEQVNADNKIVEQEIKNRLIVLKAEAKRLKAEQKQLDKEQKEEHRRRNKDALWKLYGDKLTKMKYSYVPCVFVLSMLLFFDGVKSFFDGLATVSTAIVKSLRVFIIIALIVAAVMCIPATREWILTILKFK